MASVPQDRVLSHQESVDSSGTDSIQRQGSASECFSDLGLPDSHYSLTPVRPGVRIEHASHAPIGPDPRVRFVFAGLSRDPAEYADSVDVR